MHLSRQGPAAAATAAEASGNSDISSSRVETVTSAAGAVNKHAKVWRAKSPQQPMYQLDLRPAAAGCAAGKQYRHQQLVCPQNDPKLSHVPPRHASHWLRLIYLKRTAWGCATHWIMNAVSEFYRQIHLRATANDSYETEDCR